MNDVEAIFNQRESFDLATADERRNTILSLQVAIDKEGAIEPPPVNHYFAPGNYAREIFMPAGICVIGKIHKHAHVNVISQGKVVVATEDGIVEMQAPYTFISQSGTKRVVLVLEDTVWTTIHPTDETDLEKIEDEVIAKDYQELALYNRKQLEGVMP